MEEIQSIGYCEELMHDAKLGHLGCCGACHDDWDEGYKDHFEMEVEFEGRTYWPCCNVLEAFSMSQQKPA